MAKLFWLADVLRNAGQKVEEIPGWTTRGGEMGEIKGVLPILLDQKAVTYRLYEL